MAGSGKWIDNLTATTAVEDAARRVLGTRLEAVRDHLTLALREADKDVEHVHQLRVATRRAGAALDIFAECFPDKAFRAVRKELRRLRRAAGRARDWDVFLLDLAERVEKQPHRQRPGLDALIGHAVCQRAAAQELLDAAAPHHPFAFDRLHVEALAALRPPVAGPSVLRDLARPALAALIAELDSAAARDLHDYGHLHQVRIIGKRLRYAMEVFADCFPPAFRQVHYPAVEEMQEMLGRANDSHVAVGRLTALGDSFRALVPREWSRYRSGLESLLDLHRRRLPEERDRFLVWWKRWQETGSEKALQESIAVPGGEAPPVEALLSPQ